jgi:hypothetical protein
VLLRRLRWRRELGSWLDVLDLGIEKEGGCKDDTLRDMGFFGGRRLKNDWKGRTREQRLING